MNVMKTAGGAVDLQATLSAWSVMGFGSPSPVPHHPISCINETLRYEEDGSLGCSHVATPPNDQRTKHCVQASICVLLWEALFEREGMVIK